MSKDTINILLTDRDPKNLKLFNERNSNITNIVMHSGVVDNEPLFDFNDILHFIKEDRLKDYAFLKRKFKNKAFDSFKNIAEVSIPDKNLSHDILLPLYTLIYPYVSGVFDIIQAGIFNLLLVDIKTINVFTKKSNNLIQNFYSILIIGIFRSLCDKKHITLNIYDSSNRLARDSDIFDVFSVDDYEFKLPNVDLPSKSFNIAWVGGVHIKNRSLYDKVVKFYDRDNSPILRVCQSGQSYKYPKQCVELSVGGSISSESATKIYETGIQIVEKYFDNDSYCLNNLNSAMIDYFDVVFSQHLLEIISEKFSIIDRVLNESFANIKIDTTFSCVAPIIDGLALKSWMLKQSLKPILLPHSIVSSHEMSHTSYNIALTYIMSRDVVPCTKYNGQNYDKERLMPKGCDNFDLNEISVTFSIKKTCISFIQKTLFKYNYLKTNLKSLFFLKFSSGASIKIGLVLNATGNAYDRYFASDNYYEAIRKFIHTIRNINETSSTKIILDIRIKGRANNYYRLKKIIDSRFCVISDLNQSMSNWAKSIDIAFYLSATSGFVSLIDKSVPVVSLYDSDLYFFSDEIIQAPKDIIPSLTTDELISLIFSNKDSFYELKTKQRRWLNAQRC